MRRWLDMVPTMEPAAVREVQRERSTPLDGESQKASLLVGPNQGKEEPT